jgi:hypothetical protein
MSEQRVSPQDNMLTYTAILALDQKVVPSELLNYPAAYESRDGISKPDISLPGEVILAFDATNHKLTALHLIG